MTDEGLDTGVGILVVTHHGLGQELLKAAQLIVGDQPQLAALSVENVDDVSKVVDKLKTAAKKLNKGRGVMILTDMFGGTPTNISLSIAKPGDVDVVTGVNLPMVMKALQCRKMNLAKMSEEVQSAGKSGIVYATGLLKAKKEKSSS